jgi:GH24 family phage-related lysozyme (muramidase)
MAIPQELIDMEKDFEGNIEHMYLDTGGNVTVGVGHLLASAGDAASLPFVHKSDGAAATDQEKQDEWTTMHGEDAGQVASYYDQFATLRLNQDDIDATLTDDLNAVEDSLRNTFANYDSFPQKAQEGLIDMAFNLGIGKLTSAFPNFVAAVQQQDWTTAADECHRTGISDDRNDAVKQLFLDAANAAPNT